jgi:hypothetical protein
MSAQRVEPMHPGPISPQTLPDHIRYAMEVAEIVVRSGDKAAYAKEIILRLIAESNMTEEEKTLCRAIVATGILDGIFALVVDTTTGKVNINVLKKQTKSCLKRWCPCICGKPEPDKPIHTPPSAPIDLVDPEDTFPVEPVEPIMSGSLAAETEV